MRALRYDQFGDAEQMLKLVDLPEPGAPGAGEVLVDVLYAPLNFHDLLRIGGYFAPPSLPAVAGNEGVARVAAVGDGVDNVAPGDIVVLPLLLGTWRERLIAPAAGLAPLPDGDLQQYSMLGSNTPTAGLALSQYVPLAKGDWVAQSSGNGGVGRNVIALAKHRGFRTVSIVRRPEVVDELVAAGADAVVVDGPDTVAQMSAAVGQAPVRLAIESVGGQIAEKLIDLLAPGGTLVRYSATDQLDGKGADVEFLSTATMDFPTKVAPIIAEAVPLVTSGALRVPIEAVYDLADIKPAIAHLKRGGKILLRVG
ncbi:NADPH:quinone reductase-like Zn-dependent oxidoreductase [Asanoa ferruginea]|uniref:enoyl-[acyl-carrier-protein] reductase n=1 Tax=Asanoa ferruginea TaxID=53367 RepID=A0A3D9ZX64_9ACTN|nr:zinc-dependent alcohol dehydrogenase family protein [Asanoa ferruginea]REG01143.1 NADPH:quinone reductase-like Zn-dependent oxidoreductase [Asanoa ferruginea]GIF47154.1 oxidoreductase [Asanoa ferruginea]